MLLKDFHIHLGNYKIELFVILISLLLLMQNSLQLGLTRNNNIDDSITYHRNPENKILPKTNITITSYKSGARDNVYNVSLDSINTTHWFVECSYSITNIESPFTAIVARDSINHTYFANNYYEWFSGSPSYFFEFWIDTTGFHQGYQYLIQDTTVKVLGLENITLTNLGVFEAWKLEFTTELGSSLGWYMRDSGVVLCTNFFFVEEFWFNLTEIEFASPPTGYTGPYIEQLSSPNNSILAAETQIIIRLVSPYGVYNSSYAWDDKVAVAAADYIEAVTPVSDGKHNLTLISNDNAGFQSIIRLTFITDNTLPGINLITPENNSRIKGSTPINITISSGNGSFIYHWDNEDNSTILEGTLISVINPLEEIGHSLRVYASSPSGLWTTAKYYFIVDNTEPILTLHNFQNNSLVKGTLTIDFTTSEDSSITFYINGNMTIQLKTTGLDNNSVSFPNLDNGTYRLTIKLTDTAGNTKNYTFIFSIHSSAFNWNWQVYADQPRKIDMIDENGVYWFTFILTSKTSQHFNISIQDQSVVPSADFEPEFFVKFQCESPSDVIYLTLIYRMINDAQTNNSFPVYEWIIWDSNWKSLTTAYNQISHSWEAIYEGSIPYFALVKRQDTTFLKSVKVGGGQVPSFELITGLFTVLLMVLFKNYNKRIR